MSAPSAPPRLRVVHVITTLTTGGAERQVELVAGASRHDVSVICLYAGGVVEDALRARGIAVHTLGMSGWRKLAATFRLARRLRVLRPDVVHVHLLSAQLWGIPAARLAGVPIVVSTEHSIMDTTIEGRRKTVALRLLYRMLERLATHTIAVSDATARRLAGWGIRDPARLSVINPPIDFDGFCTDGAARADVRRELGVPPDALVIGSVGRLDQVKRYEELLAAIADRLRLGAHLVVVGDGVRATAVTDQATALGVADQVHLTGPRPDVARLLDAFDLFVSASRDETFGMAVVEAIGAGLPVVYAQCPALEPVTLPAGRALRIADDSAPAIEARELATAVAALIAAGARREPAPPELVARYGAASTAAAVDALYDRLAGAKQPLASAPVSDGAALPRSTRRQTRARRRRRSPEPCGSPRPTTGSR